MRIPPLPRAFVAAFALLALAYPASAQSLRIYVIDVEQGASTLLVSPSGRTLLVDSGKNGHGVRLGAVMLLAGVSRIDHFVLTHYHEDHMGGIDDLVSAAAPTTFGRGWRPPDGSLRNEMPSVTFAGEPSCRG